MVLQRLNRLQNTNEVMLGDARSGKVRTILTERDSTWVDLTDDLAWLNGGKSFIWVSERDGWNHVYLVSRDGKIGPAGHPGGLRRLEVLGADEKSGWLYYIASPDQPSQRYLFRTRLDGKGTPGAAIAGGTSPAPTSTTGRPISAMRWRPTPASASRR